MRARGDAGRDSGHRRVVFRRVSVGLLGAATVVACQPDRPTGPPFVAPCTAADVADLTLSVGSGTEPTLSWQPACGVSQLRVDYPDPDYPELGPQRAWSVVGLFLAPPVRYGEEPPSLFPNLLPAEPLEPGRLYTARLFVYQSGVGDVEVATAEFAP